MRLPNDPKCLRSSSKNSSTQDVHNVSYPGERECCFWLVTPRWKREGEVEGFPHRSQCFLLRPRFDADMPKWLNGRSSSGGGGIQSLTIQIQFATHGDSH